MADEKVLRFTAIEAGVELRRLVKRHIPNLKVEDVQGLYAFTALLNLVGLSWRDIEDADRDPLQHKTGEK